MTLSDRSGDGLEQYTESDSGDRPGDAIESGMRETVAHPGIDGTWHHYGNIEWWEPDQLYDSDYARPICPVKHCASGRDHECRTICTRINPDEQLKSEFVVTDNPVSGGWFCTHHGWFRIHNYPRETESESEQATLLADGGRVQDTDETYRRVVETWTGENGRRYRRVVTDSGTIIEKAEDGRYVEDHRE